LSIRARLEAERRFCGNEGEALTGANVVPDKRELMAMLLDARTVNSLFSLGLQAHVEEAKAELKKLYVMFATRAFAFDQEQQLQKRNWDNGSAGNAKIANSPNSPNTDTSAAPAAATPPTGWEYLKKRTEESEQEASALVAPTEEKLEEEFDLSFVTYIDRCAKIDWNSLFDIDITPYDNGALKEEDLMKMWKVDMGIVLKQFISEDPEKKSFGYLPYMATASRASIAALLASSFCERVNSATNLILHEQNLRLSEKEINMLTVLRMNRGFMKYMRDTYPEVTLEDLRTK
jgi:hypothetical protein